MHVDVTTLGADPTGLRESTDAFREALSRIEAAGGGRLHVPPGDYLVGPLRLCSHLEFEVARGARIRFVQDPDRYPVVFTRWEGVECHAYAPMLFVEGAEDVRISGGGVIDGQGASWWRMYRDYREGRLTRFPFSSVEEIARRNAHLSTKASGGGGRESHFLRPPLLQVKDSRRVVIEGIVLRNSAFWNTHILYSDEVWIRGVSFENPPDAPNTDGLNVDSSRNVRIEDCTFDVGDDCLGLKSGIDEDGRRVGRPTEHVVIRGCIMRRGHGGIVCGSEIAGGVRNVVVTGCIFQDTDRGIRIKSRRGRGGFVENVMIHQIVMERVLVPLVVNLYYRCGIDPGEEEIVSRLASLLPLPVDETTPAVRNISISQVLATGVKSSAGFLLGLPERPIEGLVLSDYRVFMDEEGQEGEPAMAFFPTATRRGGFRGKYLKDAEFRGVRIEGAEEPAFLVEDSCSVRRLD
ncbi:glycoside hydrolase family 28 protein [Spirochaeta thermophila]|uniref:Glycoside hydrolase family 28 n=1 Tax=Winmispira thermophila (strain ATCC 49972 / DSM 6192 / RI 19.B1) TaxID=665571 RepID=E0RPT9_WINT6|nr:glycoside hydrolase family 28 protein [Spirochaeta thermophila]ADN01403.1 hypothetical protein STHERM_c04310 [Spirochaeta thermophila DSM 6192]